MSVENTSVKDIVDRLIRQIYLKELKENEKLPPFRSHAEQLEVDPTSLRSALKQLEIMNLLDIRRSDGTYVKPFGKSAGLDFLSRLFSIHDHQDGKSLVDDFLVDEVMAFWNMIFPVLMVEASHNMSALDVKSFITLTDLQIDGVDNLETLVTLDIDLQDRIAEKTNNIVVTLMFNSIRPLRVKITDFFYRNLDRETRLTFLSMKKKGLCRQLSGDLDIKWSAEEHRKALEHHRLTIRKAKMMKRIDGDR